MPRKHSCSPGSDSLPPKTFEILLRRSFWCATTGHFCSNYVMYFMVTWLPYYLVQERGLSLTGMPLVASAYFASDAVAALSTGWITDFLVRSGRRPTQVRKFSMAIGGVSAAVSLVGCALAGPHTYLAWLVSLGVSSGVSGWGPLTFAQTLAGPRAAGKWTGLQNGLANFAGVFSPMITGFLVGWTGRFTSPLALSACVALFGAFAWAALPGPSSQTEEHPGSENTL
jgi:sugar phosphate permease